MKPAFLRKAQRSPLRWVSVPSKNLKIEPLETGWHRVEQLLREALAGRTGEQMGALARGDANHHEAQARAAEAAPLLRHPDPLSRGVCRGVLGQNEHPADGPALIASLTPRRGAVRLVTGTGTLLHVRLPSGDKGWSAGLRTRRDEVLGPRPLDLLKVAGALHCGDQSWGHPTPLPCLPMCER